LIEELMLAANIAVAEFFTDSQIPGIFRVHEPPNQDAIRLLERYLWNFGSKSQLVGGSLQKKITQSLHQFENTPHAQILNILTLRSMSQAKYSANNVGHFGLGFKNYSHFTSPIRRYPDLIAHRILKSRIYAKKYKQLSEDELSSASVLLSACEQRAVKSERQFISIKKARFMERHVGSEFEGVISSVARFGVFVLLRQYEVDGLVRIEDLSQERLQFDEEHMILRGKRTGAQFRIGDIVKIKMRDVSAMDGKINFEFVELVESAVKVESALTQNVSSFQRRDSKDRRHKNQKHRGHKNRERKQGSAANFERESSERSQGPKKPNHQQRPSKHSDDDSTSFKSKKPNSFAKKQSEKNPQKESQKNLQRSLQKNVQKNSQKKPQFKSNFSGGIDNLDRNTSKLKPFLRAKK
jgi:ribonuclease R